jgi:hypothetical protein
MGGEGDKERGRQGDKGRGRGGEGGMGWTKKRGGRPGPLVRGSGLLGCGCVRREHAARGWSGLVTCRPIGRGVREKKGVPVALAGGESSRCKPGCGGG